MTTDLHQKKCIPCEEGGSALTKEEILPLLRKISGWNVIENKKIQKLYHFIDFKHAITFVNEVGDVAEFEGHHPDINLHSWNKVTISLSTHAVKGLTENDFIMAAKIDQIVSENEF